MSKGRPVISASEIGQYAYCRRAWWLARVEGHAPEDAEALAFGQDVHRRHGRAMRAAAIGQRLAYALLAAGLLAASLLMIASLLGAGGS
jgi:CRISPR/Cas system-associated exonuclease Cas4 (RecB family)